MTPFQTPYPPGATPLDPNEIAGLIPTYVSTQGELNLVEQENILRAKSWAGGRKHKAVLTEEFVRDLHRRMFHDVWRWAGEFRKSEKSIGVAPYEIATELRKLLDNTRYWIENGTYPWDELGARFHHQLVKIHPFPNGNGRHARMMTDILLETNGQKPFTWGAGTKDERSSYIAALREADERRLGRLVEFVRG